MVTCIRKGLNHIRTHIEVKWVPSWCGAVVYAKIFLLTTCKGCVVYCVFSTVNVDPIMDKFKLFRFPCLMEKWYDIYCMSMLFMQVLHTGGKASITFHYWKCEIEEEQWIRYIKNTQENDPMCQGSPIFRQLPYMCLPCYVI